MTVQPASSLPPKSSSRASTAVSPSTLTSAPPPPSPPPTPTSISVPPHPHQAEVLRIFSTYTSTQFATAGGPTIQDLGCIRNVNAWHPSHTEGLSTAIRSLLLTPTSEPTPFLLQSLWALTRSHSLCANDPPALCVLLCRIAGAKVFLDSLPT